jgi:hypothetical protein
VARQRSKYTLSTIDQTFGDQLDQWKREALPADKQRMAIKIVLMRFDGIIDENTANRLFKDLNPPK